MPYESDRKKRMSVGLFRNGKETNGRKDVLKSLKRREAYDGRTVSESLFFGSQDRITVGIGNLYCFVTVCVNRGIF